MQTGRSATNSNQLCKTMKPAGDDTWPEAQYTAWAKYWQNITSGEPLYSSMSMLQTMAHSDTSTQSRVDNQY